MGAITWGLFIVAGWIAAVVVLPGCGLDCKVAEDSKGLRGYAKIAHFRGMNCIEYHTVKGGRLDCDWSSGRHYNSKTPDDAGVFLIGEGGWRYPAYF